MIRSLGFIFRSSQILVHFLSSTITSHIYRQTVQFILQTHAVITPQSTAANTHGCILRRLSLRRHISTYKNISINIVYNLNLFLCNKICLESENAKVRGNPVQLLEFSSCHGNPTKGDSIHLKAWIWHVFGLGLALGSLCQRGWTTGICLWQP